jgi:hypothetical protein
LERKFWKAFLDVVAGFLGNNRSSNYVELVQILVKSFGEMGCKLSLIVHMMDSHLHDVKDNLGDFSEEHGERFHQDITF